MKYLATLFVLFLLIMPLFAQSDTVQEEPLCQTDNAYASLIGSEIEFDLLCKPLYPQTIELESDESFDVIINLESFKAFSGDDIVKFRIHFAIDHGRLEIQQLGGSFATQELSDSGGGNLKDIRLRTNDDVFTVEITNQGFRTAAFDLAVWPG